MNTVTYVYDHDPETVLAALCDGDFLTKRCEAMGERKIQVKVRREENQVVIENTRDVSRELPGFARKIFSPTNTVIQVERWDTRGETRRGSYDLKVKGTPVTISAKLELAPHPRGSQYSVTFDIRAKIPLIGKKIAKFTLEQTKAGLQKELDWTAAHLGEGAATRSQSAQPSR
jgi:hypothetical protein